MDGPRRAIEYSLLAGREALSTLAFDEAAVRFASAFELGIDDVRVRGETQLELGTARMRAGGSYDAIEAFRTAAQIAREISDPNLLAAAAFGFEEACSRPGITDEGAVELLEEASVALGEADSELRVRLLTGLGRAYAFIGDYPAGDAAHRSAIAMARRLDDRLGLATVLVASYWSRGDQSLEQTLEMLSEARGLAEVLGANDLQTEAMEWRVAGLIALGALGIAERELAEVHALAVQLRQPFTLHVSEHYASTLALCAGRLAEAEASARRSHEWSRLLTGRAASGVHGIQMFGIRREQGRLAELAPVVRVLADSERARGAWRAGFAALLAELGMEQDARRELARVREEGLDEFRSKLWVASLTYLADACALVGDQALAELLYPELVRLRGGNVVIGHGVACYGAADRYLGRLATTLGEHDARDRALRSGPHHQSRNGSSHLGRPHPLRVRPNAEDARPSRR